MKFFDATYPLSERTIPWPGDVQFSRKEKKGTAITSKLTMSSHAGTHIDAPRHFLFNRGGVDKIALDKLIGPARVVKSASFPLITLEEIKKIRPQKADKLLFKTRNQKLLKSRSFHSDYVSLSFPAAKFLASKKIDLVGIDYFGIEPKSAPGHPVHKTLLLAGIVIVEGLDLSRVPAGKYNMAALPLKIKNGDGAPSRVVLWK
ncbi:MAG: cyclase family protein [Candidatus Doudnabacteria bacterium]|nr:cyclase family protein [Candidatus Doudnabacteria bacterium]